MNENFNAWLETLQTTDLPQAKDHLRDGSAYCCLGIACAISPDGINAYDGLYDLLPPPVAEWLGLKDYFPHSDSFTWEDAVTQESGFDIQIAYPEHVYPTRDSSFHSAAIYNDHGMSFAQIADMIKYFGVATLMY